ncbi:MAG: metalloregulator ArsR/SmtB family transcription factor [Saprospiraceae bacterium]|nr:metalloregulator ArsR/SmtB family transcription factor [Saprospiraceae bacterium]
MRTNILGNPCIRANRDEAQINRCKTLLSEFGTKAENASRIIDLAGNEVRLKILLLLQAEERLCVCDLSDVLNMKIPAVSQHLRKLKDAGIVITERDGTVIYYQISNQALLIIGSLLELVPGFEMPVGI